MFRRILITAIVLYFSVGAISAQSRTEVLKKCEMLFGKPVDEQLSLFEVNRYYVLRVDFNKKDRLREFAVEPKFYFEDSHPEWAETADNEWLTEFDLRSLLGRLDGIKQKGPITRPSAKFSVVTNLTAWNYECHVNGYVTWGQLVDLRLPDNSPVQVKWFRVTFEKPKRIKLTIRPWLFPKSIQSSEKIAIAGSWSEYRSTRLSSLRRISGKSAFTRA